MEELNRPAVSALGVQTDHHHHQPINVPTAYGLHIRNTGHNPPRGPSAGWWVLTTAIAAGTNGLSCLPKHRRAQDNKFSNG
jgi:hypothetical protein